MAPVKLSPAEKHARKQRKSRESSQRYRERNKEKIQRAKKLYHSLNKESINQKQKQYDLLHRYEIVAYKKKYHVERKCNSHITVSCRKNSKSVKQSVSVCSNFGKVTSLQQTMRVESTGIQMTVPIKQT